MVSEENPFFSGTSQNPIQLHLLQYIVFVINQYSDNERHMKGVADRVEVQNQRIFCKIAVLFILRGQGYPKFYFFHLSSIKIMEN